MFLGKIWGGGGIIENYVPFFFFFNTKNTIVGRILKSQRGHSQGWRFLLAPP